MKSAAMSYSSIICTIKVGVIRSLKGTLLEIITTEPYSPTARLKPWAMPARMAGVSWGSTTRKKVWAELAPRHQEASSCSRSRARSTGSTVRTTKGREMNTIATATPRGVNDTSRPVSR